jgi:hypothetical protein
MDLASPYPGFGEFVATARKAGHDLFIVSHKTRHPILGPRHDLHAAARGFLIERGLVGADRGQIDPANVFFELTKEAKVARITALGCEAFIDDLPEIFASPDFPGTARRILFDPVDQFTDLARQRNLDRRGSWTDIAAELCREHV